jgi:hypothetical protein
LEALLDGGRRVELSLDGREASLQLGVLLEPLISCGGLAFEVAEEDLV